MSVKKWLNDHNLAVSAIGVSVLVALLSTSSIWAHRVFVPWLKIENSAQDWIYRLGRTAPKDPRICFLADDAASHSLSHLWEEEFEAAPILKRMKRRSWPRDVYGAILDRLVSAGARVVGFDYIYPGEDPDGDPAWRESLDRNAAHVVIGSHLDDVKVAGTRLPQLVPPPKTLIGEAGDPRVGFVNIYPDADEVVRRFRFRITREEMANLEGLDDGQEYESLATRMVRQAGESDKLPPGRGEHLIRFAYKGETLLDESKPPSVANIFVQAYWEKNYKDGTFFKDKIVLVGPEGNYSKDVALSPFGTIAGPEFHLNIANALLTNSFLHATSVPVNLLLIFCGGLAAFAMGARVGHPVVRVALAAVLGAGYFAIALWFFNNRNLILPVFSPTVALVGSAGLFIVWQQIIERLEKAKLRHTFERYVSRDVVKELVDNPQSFLNSLVGVRKNVTVLFSDVRGFTTITQTGDATRLVAQLNEYFDHMVNIVFANRGTLDKFIGDAVMAQWGGITTSGEKEDAVNAVRAAVQMRAELVDLNKLWIEQGRLDLKIGIGINHGEAIVGNLGSEAKSEISLIGDAVNTASRFEGMTKQYHVDLIIGENVAALVRDRFIIRTIAQSQPKGTLKPIEIFTVLSERTNGSVEPAWLASYEEGVTLYRGREFAKAAERFESVLTNIPNDWLCESYLAESRKFAANPPPPDWSPVDVLTSK
jgi:adenylate cyclase